MLHRAAVCCRVLQGVAGCGSVLQCVTPCCNVLQYVAVCVASCCSVLLEWKYLEVSRYKPGYGVALVSRIDTMIGLFCKRAQKKRRYSAEETCNFIDPTDRSHPIA